jgi:hypothetical protein
MTSAARIREKKKRVVEHHWRGATTILRGQFMACQIKRIHAGMVAREALSLDPCDGVLLPMPFQMLKIHKGESGAY